LEVESLFIRRLHNAVEATSVAARVTGLILFMVLARVPFPLWVDAAPSPASWWVVSKIDISMGSESGSVLSFTGPLSSLDQCNLLLGDVKEGYKEKQRRLLESDPAVQTNLSIARCQTSVVIAQKGNSPWWAVAKIQGEFGTQSVHYFTYAGPHTTLRTCNDYMEGFKRGFSQGAADRSNQSPGYRNRLLSATCARMSITY
jgi:hypothetical protein